MTKTKPDNVADNPALLPYGSNVGAPSILIPNIDHWKQPRVSNVNKQFLSKFENLKEEYQKLIGKIKEQMTNIPYVDAIGRKYFYGELFCKFNIYNIESFFI